MYRSKVPKNVLQCIQKNYRTGRVVNLLIYYRATQAHYSYLHLLAIIDENLAIIITSWIYTYVRV